MKDETKLQGKWLALWLISSFCNVAILLVSMYYVLNILNNENLAGLPVFGFLTFLIRPLGIGMPPPLSFVIVMILPIVIYQVVWLSNMLCLDLMYCSKDRKLKDKN